MAKANDNSKGTLLIRFFRHRFEPVGEVPAELGAAGHMAKDVNHLFVAADGVIYIARRPAGRQIGLGKA